MYMPPIDPVGHCPISMDLILSTFITHKRSRRESESIALEFTLWRIGAARLRTAAARALSKLK